MKKGLIITGGIILVLAGALGTYLSRPSAMVLAVKAEAQGNYAEALEHFVSVINASAGTRAYPDKKKAVGVSEAAWKKTVEDYVAWTTSPVMQLLPEFSEAVKGIVRCTSFVTNANFITEKPPKALPGDSLFKQWREPFFRERKNDFREMDDLIARAVHDSVSILCIRAMNGYIYTAKLIDIQTGKGTDFILYPNTSISLLIKPHRYFLICSSEVQFTEGLTGRTWRSPDNVIPVIGPEQTSLQQITLKTRVNRS